jgi:hypothetical protein
LKKASTGEAALAATHPLAAETGVRFICQMCARIQGAQKLQHRGSAALRDALRIMFLGAG